MSGFKNRDYYWKHQGSSYVNNDFNSYQTNDKHFSNHHRSPSLATSRRYIYNLEGYNSYQQRNYSQKSYEYDNETTYSFNNYSIYEPKKSSFSYQNHHHNSNYNYDSNYNYNYDSNYNYNKSTHHAPLSQEDERRQKIAEDNKKMVLQNPKLIDKHGVKTIDIDYHFHLKKNHRKGIISVVNCSSIDAAIQSYSHFSKQNICLLNFANPIKPGGGYLNGRNAQEECICRQTLLYPTIDGNYMYIANKRNGSKPEASDIMIYSPNVLVIRDNNYKKIKPFKINIISSAAVDNRSGKVRRCDEIMYRRIKKIIMTAASENNDVLILGAFGCGVFKNDPYQTARSFYDVLVKEEFKFNFDKIIFPIYNNPQLYQIFKSTLNNF